VIGLIGVVAFLVAAFSPLADRLNRWLSVPPDLVRADAIVVLGGSVSRSGVLSLESQRRTNRGIELYQRGLAPLLVLLGGSSGGGPTEADVRAEQARLHGFEVHSAPSDPFGEADAPESRLSLTRALLKESLGWLYYRIAGYI